MSSRQSSARGRTRGIVVVVVVIVVAAVAAWAWRQRDATGDEGAYRTTPVEQGDIRVAISATGTLSAISTVVVGSQISGQVTDVLVDFNDRVEKDQVIARIDPSTFDAQIAQGAAQIAVAEASLRQAQATLANADIDYRRKADLGGSQLVARSDVDLARAARDQAQAQVTSARAQIQQQTASTQATRINLQRTVIRSPVDGVVLTRTIEPGQTVAASLSAPELFQIAEDLGQMKIELAVDEADIGQVKAGQGVSFTADAFADRQFRGTVAQVRLAATNTNNVVTYPVVVSVDNSDGTLLPGLTVNAEIEVSRRDDILKVSNAALRYKPTGEQAAAAGAAGAPGAGRGAGMVEDLARVATSLRPAPAQQAAFDEAAARIAARQAAREAAPAPAAGGMFGGGGRGGQGAAPGGGAVPAQMRQRMVERYQQDFAAFRAMLDDGQRATWDAALAAQVGATRAPLYRLVDGVPERVMVRIGASDGTSTEVSGALEAGDEVVTGERAAP